MRIKNENFLAVLSSFLLIAILFLSIKEKRETLGTIINLKENFGNLYNIDFLYNKSRPKLVPPVKNFLPFTIQLKQSALDNLTIGVGEVEENISYQWAKILEQFYPVSVVKTYSESDSYNRLLSKNPRKKITFAMCSEYWLYNKLKNKKPKDIVVRKVCSFLKKYIFLVVHSGSGIRSFKDLEGKNIGLLKNNESWKIYLEQILKIINVTPEGTVTFDNMPDLLNNLTSNNSNFFGIEREKPFQKGIDAFLLVSTSPNYYLLNLIKSINKNVIVIPLSVKTLDPNNSSLTEDMLNTLLPYTEKTFINMNKYKTYTGRDMFSQARQTRVLILTHKDTPDKYVFNFIKSIVDNFEKIVFKLRGSKPRFLLSDSYSYNNLFSTNQAYNLHIHNGALNYYRKVGFITNNPSDSCIYSPGTGFRCENINYARLLGTPNFPSNKIGLDDMVNVVANTSKTNNTFSET